MGRGASVVKVKDGWRRDYILKPVTFDFTVVRFSAILWEYDVFRRRNLMYLDKKIVGNLVSQLKSVIKTTILRRN